MSGFPRSEHTPIFTKPKRKRTTLEDVQRHCDYVGPKVEMSLKAMRPAGNGSVVIYQHDENSGALTPLKTDLVIGEAIAWLTMLVSVWTDAYVTGWNAATADKPDPTE